MLEAAPAPLGEPMEIIEPPPPGFTIDRTPSTFWVSAGDTLPGLQRSGTVSPRACPVCDSRANKTVRKVSCAMMITCQVCGHEWQIS